MTFFTDLIYRLKHGRAPSEPKSAENALVETNEVPKNALPANGKTSHPDNRILAGRREFMGQFADLAKGKHNWQVAAFVSLGLLAIMTIAYIQLASTSRITPYVVEVDELGQARAFGPAERALKASDRLTIHQLTLFIRNLRTVYRDPLAQKDMIVRAYAFADAEAQEWLNGYFSDPKHDPRLLAQNFSRQVEIKSIIRVPESDTWKVSWIETETRTGTNTRHRSAWEGYLTVRQEPPATAATMKYNPLGLYVTAVNWTQVSRGTS